MAKQTKKSDHLYHTFVFLNRGGTWQDHLQEAVATYRTALRSEPVRIIVHPKLQPTLTQAEKALGLSLPVTPQYGIPTWELWLE